MNPRPTGIVAHDRACRAEHRFRAADHRPAALAQNQRRQADQHRRAGQRESEDESERDFVAGTGFIPQQQRTGDERGDTPQPQRAEAGRENFGDHTRPSRAATAPDRRR